MLRRLPQSVSAALLVGGSLCAIAQIGTGALEISVTNGDGQPRPAIKVSIRGALSEIEALTDPRGRALLVLPRGEYRVTADNSLDRSVVVRAQETTRVEVVTGGPSQPTTGLGPVSSPYSLHGVLLIDQPATVAEPLDFSGLASMRLPLVSQRGFSWTATGYALEGMNATDPYQPGRPLMFPDLAAVNEVTVHTGFDLGTSTSFGSEIGVFLRQASRAWHGALESINTGSALAGDNLPPPEERGAVQQAERFNWYTRDHVEAGGPLGHRADIFFSGTGQWASQRVPIAASGPSLRSRLLFGNIRGRVQLTQRDQLEGQFSGSRIDLSNWGVPQGLEPLVGSAGGPSFQPPFGFAGLREEDHLDTIHAGWTRQFSESAVLQIRYAFSPAHRDTTPVSPSLLPSQTELVSDLGRGIPPVANLSVRTRQALRGALDVVSAPWLQNLTIGGGMESAKIRNRLTAPSDTAWITAAGTPAYVVQLNTPLDSRARVRLGTVYVRDRLTFSWLTIDAALAGDFARGDVPRQSSPQGNFAPARQFDELPALIDWNSLSPRIGLAAAPLRFLILRGNYLRSYAPLAGRYLDYGNANSLGGSVYRNGYVVRNFGGPYSRIDPNLHRPYADEFNAGVDAPLSDWLAASLRLFRRDEKQRIAAVLTGVAASAFQGVPILDPGPDGIPGTVDDQMLTVYGQDPATFGNDRYSLTNPAGLRESNQGLVAELTGRTRYLQAHASFMAIKAWGPTNAGNAALQNDPGAIGELYRDPNSLIHAAGRSFFDRAYVGKLQISGLTPSRLGRIEWASTVNYLDGLVFGRRLLVTSLPHGPILVAATLRGSPEGGNRSEYVLQWNLRVGRSWELPVGRLIADFDLFNVLNSSQRLEESDATGPQFNLRLPISIQPPRFAQFGVQYRF